ncbi:NAD(P)-dependent oxidoreductase [Mycolicibacterium neworleansense]|uniref:NAD-dependent epimerase/dehydratase n=1 Tax=Mycolicibacterium neworleansense TaxID=146018 RepID=A0A0H5RJU3_9MYCO|nr:NAD(P)H-binding protein [Mycolicibacterium neworleansense]MCV7361728.1 NAD(P)H-binding protein [Mycolicibacterium neworleansense]CRZ14031.1 NAD-dependent epimerase/dehydratase [Mycolicibacterium neworleansense]
MKVTLLGAGGPTGRLLLDKLLSDGHDVTALVRRPPGFPASAPRLRVLHGDATTPADVCAAVADADAVVSVLGTGFSRQPIHLYSASAQAICSALAQAGIRRLIVTSSAALSDWTDPGWNWGERVVGRRILGYLGRTLYADMAGMEAIVSASSLDWTIMRPLGLATMDAPTTYRIAEDHIPGRQTARRDLAAAIADQLSRTDYHGKTVAVATADKHQSLARTLWREGIKPNLACTSQR